MKSVTRSQDLILGW